MNTNNGSLRGLFFSNEHAKGDGISIELKLENQNGIWFILRESWSTPPDFGIKLGTSLPN